MNHKESMEQLNIAQTKQQIEEVNQFVNGELLTLFLEANYPGFTEYVETIKNREKNKTGLSGTENLIEETKQLIKESEEDFISESKEEYVIDIASLPSYLGNTHEEKINNYIKLKNSGIELLGLPSMKDNSDFESWIEVGKELIYKELVSANENLNNMYDTLAELNDDITDEEDRVEKLLNLLGTIND